MQTPHATGPLVMLGYTFQHLLSANSEKAPLSFAVFKACNCEGEGRIFRGDLFGFLILLHFHGKGIFL